MSYGMVLCASDASHEAVEPVAVPEGVALGEKVTFEGFTGKSRAVVRCSLVSGMLSCFNCGMFL